MSVLGYLPSAGGIFTGPLGGVLGDADQFLEAAGGFGQVTKYSRKVAELEASGLSHEQALQQTTLPTTPVALPPPALLAGLGNLPILPIAAAGAAYFLLPQKYKTLGSAAVGALVWFGTNKKSA